MKSNKKSNKNQITEYLRVPKGIVLDLLTEILAGEYSQEVCDLAIRLEHESKPLINSKMRTFDDGATRESDENKLDYEGFLSPIVIKRYAEYLYKHCLQSDGQMRGSDNWQKGIPKDVYMKSLCRHLIDMWSEHRGFKSRDGMEDAICGIVFNSMGYLYEMLKEKKQEGEF